MLLENKGVKVGITEWVWVDINISQFETSVVAVLCPTQRVAATIRNYKNVFCHSTTIPFSCLFCCIFLRNG